MNHDNLQGLLLLAVLSYFLPAIVAGVRRHRNRLAITVLNIVSAVASATIVGWMIGALAWIVALIWACTNDCHKRDPTEPGLWAKLTGPSRWDGIGSRILASSDNRWERLKARRKEDAA